MKVTFEQVTRGVLLTAEEGGEVERLVYESPLEALQAVASALGINLAPAAAAPVVRAPIVHAAAPSPEPEPDPEPTAPSYDNPPPATRRNGLIQPSKRLGPPAGRAR